MSLFLRTTFLLITFSTIFQNVLIECTSIPSSRPHKTKRSLNFTTAASTSEILYGLDPYSMEDLASKEKIIVNATPLVPPEVILGRHFTQSSTEISTTEEEMDSEEGSEEEDSGSTENEDEITTTDLDEPVDVDPPPKSTLVPPLLVETGVNVNANPDNEGTTTTTEVMTPTPTPATMATTTTERVHYSVDEGRRGRERLTYSQPMPVISHVDENIDERLFLILQNAVRETYFSFRDILGSKYRNEVGTMEDELRAKLHQLDVDLNVKVVALDTTTHSRIQTLTDQIIDQRKEDIQTFSDNLHQLQKTHQMHIDSQKVEIQQLQVTMELLTKGQSTLSTKMSQLQKTVNNLDSKVTEMVIKNSEDLGILKDSQKILGGVVEELQLDIKTNDAEFKQVQEIVRELQKAATEDHGKLRRTIIRDQKQDPIANAIRHLKNKNVGAALKQWRSVESITDDLKETLPLDISRIVEESYGKNAANMATVVDFIHRAVAGHDRRLKETAYGAVMQDMDASRQLTDGKKTVEIFNLAQTMKSDLGVYYNSSAITAEIVGKLPEIIKLITFDKVKLLLPSRGYLRVAADRKVTLVSQEGRFYDRDEILWQFEYDKEKSDGTFYIKSDKLQKYLVTLHEGFNSYGFSKQGLFVTGNKKENGTRFQMTIVNRGEYVLFKSVFYNGYLTWKSNIQTIYGDDDSYFLLLVDRKNGPSPFWNVMGENDSYT